MKMVTYIVDGISLQAPESFVNATREQHKAICNGIGPKWMFGGVAGTWLWFLKSLLDHIWFLDCTILGDIHDWMYYYLAALPRNKILADKVFMENAEAWINGKTRCSWLRKLRLHRVHAYYNILTDWGYKAFYDREV